MSVQTSARQSTTDRRLTLLAAEISGATDLDAHQADDVQAVEIHASTAALEDVQEDLDEDGYTVDLQLDREPARLLVYGGRPARYREVFPAPIVDELHGHYYLERTRLVRGEAREANALVAQKTDLGEISERESERAYRWAEQSAMVVAGELAIAIAERRDDVDVHDVETAVDEWLAGGSQK